MVTGSQRVGGAALVFLAAVAMVAPLRSAYKGHADDRDVEAVLAAYPALKSTPADSCATCHRSGDVKPATGGGVRNENHCDFCHAVFVRDKRDVKETLNRYGSAYLAAGRGAGAVRGLASSDADGDGFSNEVELARGTNPGDAASSPSVPLAPSRIYSASALKSLSPVVEETIFVNSTKSKSGDSYSDYRGNVVWDLLQAIGVRPDADSIDVIAADGYERTFTFDELKKSWPQAAPVEGLGTKDLGPCGWVSYASRRLQSGKPLAEARIIFAFEENGAPLVKAKLDPESGRITGKGPFRSAAPQFRLSPPDLSQFADPSCAAKVAPEHRFHDDYDHNAGAGVSAIVAVRVKPLPKGTRDVDWQTPAARYLADEQVVFFGALKQGP